MNLRVFYLTRRGISDGYTKVATEIKKGARTFIVLLLYITKVLTLLFVSGYTR